MEEKEDIQQLSAQEKNLIDYIRQFGYGEITVFIQAGKPVRIERIRESIQLK